MVTLAFLIQKRVSSVDFGANTMNRRITSMLSHQGDTQFVSRGSLSHVREYQISWNQKRIVRPLRYREDNQGISTMIPVQCASAIEFGMCNNMAKCSGFTE